MQGCDKRIGYLNLPDKILDQYIIRGCVEVAQCIWDNNVMDIYAQRQASMEIFNVIEGYF